MRTRIVARKLTPSEAKIFSEEIRLVPGIAGYRPKDLMKLPHVIVVEEGDDAAGMLAYTEAKRYVELKLLLVRQQFQNRGCGRVLFDHFNAQTTYATKVAYAVTKNPVVMHLLEDAGYKRTAFWLLPLVCKLHPLRFLQHGYQVRAYLWKWFLFPGSGSYQYWVKMPSK